MPEMQYFENERLPGTLLNPALKSITPDSGLVSFQKLEAVHAQLLRYFARAVERNAVFPYLNQARTIQNYFDHMLGRYCDPKNAQEERFKLNFAGFSWVYNVSQSDFLRAKTHFRRQKRRISHTVGELEHILSEARDQISLTVLRAPAEMEHFLNYGWVIMKIESGICYHVFEFNADRESDSHLALRSRISDGYNSVAHALREPKLFKIGFDGLVVEATGTDDFPYLYTAGPIVDQKWLDRMASNKKKTEVPATVLKFDPTKRKIKT